ncbi:MAG: Asp-tRNA(Asn)/Glu-tRNA(Gln) amidotransferase subunit GatC [Mycoplasmataceae bacterium]|jgi:aspartyl/glutamyl-tRNA(Asn/Gln) amidotransferase C subunit|nr:Asp-tRNA(Asn)/Glu-tRNA(Gln) amidotransferase subunit GatC [Mycoplasmataceae bacterium]
MKITIDEIKNLAEELHFDLNQDELEKLTQKADELLSKLNDLNDINIKNVKPMHYPLDKSEHPLREDEPIKVNNPEEYLKNTKHRKNKFVVVE